MNLIEEKIREELVELQGRVLVLDDMLVAAVAYELMMAPAKMFADVCDKIKEMAAEECWGEEKIKQELLELQMRLELDEMTEEEYMVAEAALMERLEEGRKQRGEGGEEE